MSTSPARSALRPTAPDATAARADAAVPVASSATPCPTACSRASVLRAGVALAVGGGTLALAGCGGPAAVSEPPAGGGEKVTVAADDVPVGGAVSQTVGEDEVLVVQPAEGEFVAFSAVCPHAGGIVAPAGDLVGQCPLHGSRFDLGDGAAVLAAPADEPLAEYPLTVSGDQLELG